jgi:hypothetical protein
MSDSSPAHAAFAGTAISAVVNLSPVQASDWGRLAFAVFVAIASAVCYRLTIEITGRVLERLRRKRD